MSSSLGPGGGRDERGLGAGRDVAPRVGLYDQSQLNRHFRRIVGVMPGEFRRREQRFEAR